MRANVTLDVDVRQFARSTLALIRSLQAEEETNVN